MLRTTLLLLPLLAAPERAGDPRDHYDVTAYEMQWAVVPSDQRLEGRVVVRAKSVATKLARVTLDMQADLELLGATTEDGKALTTEREGDLLHVTLPAELAMGDEFAVALRYRGHPKAKDSFTGFHWAKTADGSPWVNTSCQGLGAHSWWPCKASYFNANDKPERISVELTVPKGLTGVSNGRFQGATDGGPEWFAAEGDWQTFRYSHPYPLETYSVTLNVAPYVTVEQQLMVEGGGEAGVPFVYYVLPENAAKAAVQFQQVPGLIDAFTRAFGPWPFPESKIALVETNFWGMEHSSAVAYGSTYPAWCEQEGEPDRYASRNEYFDYILVHEMAHEWWGNAVSATDWGHFWIHEGLGTYAEGAYLEFTEGRERADEYFRDQNRGASRMKGSLYRGDDVDSGAAYSPVIYSKGACVLNTLRHFIGDDETWWQLLHEFQARYRYRNANTEDFFALLQELTQANYGWFAQQYVYGEGSPRLKVDVEVEPRLLKLRIDNETGDFDCAVDITWLEGGETRHDRVWVRGGKSGGSDYVLAADATEVAVPNLNRIIGKHTVRIHGHGVPENGAGESTDGN
ncbi:MAG: M1 family metallopeptidase [Planctomycetes bacterium]|nr:M1 family metallopeptidase [Planctomycetota bacterium]